MDINITLEKCHLKLDGLIRICTNQNHFQMYKMFATLTVFQFLDAFPSSNTLKDSKNPTVNLLLELWFRAAAVADQYEVIPCHSKTNFTGRPYVS